MLSSFLTLIAEIFQLTKHVYATNYHPLLRVLLFVLAPIADLCLVQYKYSYRFAMTFLRIFIGDFTFFRHMYSVFAMIAKILAPPLRLALAVANIIGKVMGIVFSIAQIILRPVAMVLRLAYNILSYPVSGPISAILMTGLTLAALFFGARSVYSYINSRLRHVTTNDPDPTADLEQDLEEELEEPVQQEEPEDPAQPEPLLNSFHNSRNRVQGRLHTLSGTALLPKAIRAFKDVAHMINGADCAVDDNGVTISGAKIYINLQQTLAGVARINMQNNLESIYALGMIYAQANVAEVTFIVDACPDVQTAFYLMQHMVGKIKFDADVISKLRQQFGDSPELEQIKHHGRNPVVTVEPVSNIGGPEI